MQLSENHVDELSLSRFGEEVVASLNQRDFQGLASRFGYALAYGRDLAVAIGEDFNRAVSEPQESNLGKDQTITVKYFKPNDSNLYALVECSVPISQGLTVLLELIVTHSGDEYHITLEDIS